MKYLNCFFLFYVVKVKMYCGLGIYVFILCCRWESCCFLLTESQTDERKNWAPNMKCQHPSEHSQKMCKLINRNIKKNSIIMAFIQHYNKLYIISNKSTNSVYSMSFCPNTVKKTCLLEQQQLKGGHWQVAGIIGKELGSLAISWDHWQDPVMSLLTG